MTETQTANPPVTVASETAVDDYLILMMGPGGELEGVAATAAPAMPAEAPEADQMVDPVSGVVGAKVSGSAHDPLETQNMMEVKARQSMGVDGSQEAIEARGADLVKAQEYALQLSREGFSYDDIVTMVGSQFLTVPLESIRKAVDHAHAQHNKADRVEGRHEPDKKVEAFVPMQSAQLVSGDSPEVDDAAEQAKAEEARQQAVIAQQQHDAAVVTGLSILASGAISAEDLAAALKNIHPHLNDEQLRNASEAAMQAQEQAQNQAREQAQQDMAPQEPQQQPEMSSLKQSFMNLCNEIVDVTKAAIQRVSQFLNPKAQAESAAIAGDMLRNGQVTGIAQITPAQQQAITPNVSPQLAQKAAKSMSAN